MNPSVRVYDKQGRRRIYVSKFGIISLYKYYDNYVEEVKIDNSDRVVYLKRYNGSDENSTEKSIDSKYLSSIWIDGEYSYEYRLNIEKETVWKKKTKILGDKKIAYSEYYEKDKLIESNILFNVDHAIINNWIKLINYEYKEN